MNYLDLFHGIGGFALGAYWAGMKFDNHLCSDIEPFAVELYKKRFPDSVQLGDITKIDWHKLKKDYPGEWIISGGFPCQDISVAGKGKGLIDEKTGKKTRSGLWYDYQEGISILRPRFAIMENVGALLNRGIDSVLGTLSEIGYNAEWQTISAAEMGAPHRRERVWIISYPDCFRYDILQRESKKRRQRITQPFPTGISSHRTENTLLAQYSRDVYGLSSEMDKLKGLGNAIVPQIAEILFNLIKDVK
jgi:DNA (cytosine-5)-methyltransferase 1